MTAGEVQTLPAGLYVSWRQAGEEFLTGPVDEQDAAAWVEACPDALRGDACPTIVDAGQVHDMLAGWPAEAPERRVVFVNSPTPGLEGMWFQVP